MIHEAYPVSFICGLVANTCFLPRSKAPVQHLDLPKGKKRPRNACMCLKVWTGPQADTSETFSHLWWRTSRLCQPEWCPSFRTMLDGGPHPRNGKYSVC